MPERIQRKRTKGWSKGAAVVVSRPTRWGNPYTLFEMRDVYPDADDRELRRMCVSDFRGLLEGRWDRLDDVPEYPSPDEVRRELAGSDLACWCPLDQPCHADVLLEIANAKVTL